MRVAVRPFLVPSPAAWRLKPWVRRVDTDAVVLGDRVADWDANLELLLSRSIDLDLDRVRDEAALAKTAPLDLVVSWRASSTHLRDTALRLRLEDAHIELDARLPGRDLGGVLTLATRVVLAERCEPSAASAWLAGSVLLEDTFPVRLEGDAAQFPISAVDFAAIGLPSRARWHLEVPDDVRDPALGAVRLFLNSQDAELMAAATGAGKPAPVQRQLLGALADDVTRQLVELAIDASGELADAAPDSFAAGLVALLEVMFGDTPTTIAAQRARDRSRFATELQAAIRARSEDVLA